MTAVLLHVIASFECEGCGKPFGVMIDNHVQTEETIYELAVDNLSAGRSDGPMHHGMCSLIDGAALCPECTTFIRAKLRDEGINEDAAKRDWVLRWLGSVVAKTA